MWMRLVTQTPDGAWPGIEGAIQRKINMSMQLCPELIFEDWAGGREGGATSRCVRVTGAKKELKTFSSFMGYIYRNCLMSEE